LSLCVGLVMGPILIPILRKLKFGQSVRDDGPQSHLKKQGTPTMGGVMFFFTLIFGVVFFAHNSLIAWYLLFAALGYGLIGFVDDYIKIIKHRSLGLTAMQKIVAQVFLSGVLIFTALKGLGISTDVVIPGTGVVWKMGMWYIPFAFILLIGTTNAVNLTDGLDGLASGVTLIVATGFGLVAYQMQLSAAAVFAAAMVGSCLSFLVYNKYPAKIFMGDTGSFVLGGGIAALAIVTKTELLLPIFGAIYVAEALSDIIQVLAFKIKKKRVFRMAPLHHHFELGGWKEQKVVLVFWSCAAFMVLLGLVLFLLTDIKVMYYPQEENDFIFTIISMLG